MSASFRRKKPRDNASGVGLLKGSKPWTGGITLTSVGLRDLDAVLGGGQPFATSLLLEEDRWTRDLSLCLIKYWCAEAVSHEQALLIPSFQDDESDLPTSAPLLVQEDHNNETPKHGPSKSQINQLIDSLPRNLHWDKAAGKASVLEEQEASLRPLEILEEEDEEDTEEGLQIAWQYRKSVQTERLGQKSTATTPLAKTTSNTYCHSFDLNGRLSDQDMNRDCIQIFDAACDCEGGSLKKKCTCGWKLFHTLKQQIQKQPKGKVIRLLLYQAPVEAASIAVPLLLTYIRSEALPVVLLVTVHSWTTNATSESTLFNLRRACDVVLQTEGFASRIHYPPPAEFRHLQGLLLLPKVATGGMNHFADMTMSKRPPANVYGLKRDRRKLHMPLLHIPPEDYAGEGGSVAGGGVRSGAGRPIDKPSGSGCSSGGNSKLDF